MACADAAESERTFLAALGSARSWRVIGEHLDLFDGAGDLAARFEAKNLN
jgi:heat shock protein HslJ